jgi:hypothetical protein
MLDNLLLPVAPTGKPPTLANQDSVAGEGFLGVACTEEGLTGFWPFLQILSGEQQLIEEASSGCVSDALGKPFAQMAGAVETPNPEGDGDSALLPEEGDVVIVDGEEIPVALIAAAADMTTAKPETQEKAVATGGHPPPVLPMEGDITTSGRHLSQVGARGQVVLSQAAPGGTGQEVTVTDAENGKGAHPAQMAGAALKAAAAVPPPQPEEVPVEKRVSAGQGGVRAVVTPSMGEEPRIQTHLQQDKGNSADPGRQPPFANTNPSFQPEASTQDAFAKAAPPTQPALTELPAASLREAAAGGSESGHGTPRDGLATPVDKSDLLGQIVERATMIQKGQQSEMRMTLKPEVLGHLRMHVITENHSVVVRIVAENGMVKDVIEGNLQALKDSLAGQGLAVDDVEVSIEQEYENKDPKGNQNQLRHSRRSAGSGKDESITRGSDKNEALHREEGEAENENHSIREGGVDYFA